MTRRRNAAYLAGCAGLAWLLVTPGTAASQPPTLTPPRIELFERGAPPLLKPKVPFNSAFSLSELAASRNPAILNRSMKARRDVAWQILQRLWAPVSPAPASSAGGRAIPVWMSWYEQEDIAQLYDEMLSRKGPPAKAGLLGDLDAVLRAHAAKDLQVSLGSARLGRALRQFSFPGSLGPHRTPSTGAIYYSPAYVRHILANAERIATCNPLAYPAPSPKPTLPGEMRPILGIESVPAGLRPSNPKNLYALCMEDEMPPDAVMVKTAWAPLRTAGLRPGDAGPAGVDQTWLPGQHDFQLDRTMASRLFTGTAGEWIERPWRTPGGGARVPPGTGWRAQFVVRDEAGNDWALMGMHVAAKTVPSWLWITLFSQGDGSWSWRGDKTFPYWGDSPEGPVLRGSMYYYGMCVVSDFAEEDPAPWAAYHGTTSAFAQELADALRAVAGVMGTRQWCSNPYIETDMARGNCIGCHQGSPASFLPTTLTRQLAFNVSDFSFSFSSIRAAILDIRRRHGLGEKGARPVRRSSRTTPGSRTARTGRSARNGVPGPWS